VLYSSGSGSGVSSPAFLLASPCFFLSPCPGYGLDTWHRYLVDVLPTSPRKRYVKNFSLNGLLARFVHGVPSLNAPVALPDDAWLWILRTRAALGPALLKAYLTRGRLRDEPRQSSGSCTVTLLTLLLVQPLPLSWDHYVLGRFRFSRCWLPLGGNWSAPRALSLSGVSLRWRWYLLANLGFDGAELVPACRCMVRPVGADGGHPWTFRRARRAGLRGAGGPFLPGETPETLNHGSQSARGAPSGGHFAVY